MGRRLRDQGAPIETAELQERLEARRRHLYDAYAAAASDPAFLEDMEITNAAFDATVADGLKSSD